MGIVFNADEVLGLAVEIERNGRSFYLRAAGIVKDAGVRKLLSDLAEWEKGHQVLFEGMRSGLTDDEKTSTAHDPDGEAELYLQAMADAHVFKADGEAGSDPAAALSGKESAGEIIKIALGLEQESILFYLGLAKMVPARLGNERVQKIIDEEMGHVAYLKREQKKLAEA